MFNQRLGYEVMKANMRDALHEAEEERLAQFALHQQNGRVTWLLSRLSFRRYSQHPVSQRVLQRRTAIILLLLSLLSLLTLSITQAPETVPSSAPMGEIGDQSVTEVPSEDALPCPPTIARLLCPNTG
jgi:hypothetical protein